MRTRSLAGFASLVLFLAMPATARGGDFEYGPWLQNATTDSMVVMWQGDTTEPATVAWGLTDAYESGSVGATQESVNGHTVYTARITGLTANTIYRYQVTYGSSTASATFKTLPAVGTTGFRYYVAGDNRSNPGTWATVTDLVHEDMSEYPEHHQTILVNTGDIVADGSDDGDWDQLWPPARDLLMELPLYVGFGNHEDRCTSSSDGFIYGYFDLPYAESGSTDEKWYSFDLGNAHFTAIAIYADDGYSSGPQRAWIESDLSDASTDPMIGWMFPFLHFLPWSLGHHDYDEASGLRDHLHPLFDTYSADVVWGGHNHIWVRYAPIDGVTYITSGGGGAGLSSDSGTGWPGGTMEEARAVHHYTVVDVEADVVAIRAIDQSGERFDWVTLGGTTLDRPPLADAGPNQDAAVDSTVDLDGTASVDPEGSSLTWEWEQVVGPTVILSGGDTANPSFVPAVGGKYVFELRVYDGVYWSAPDFVAVRAAAGQLSLEPVADTYVDAAHPTTNNGSSTSINIDQDPDEYHTYLRFDVSGIEGDVESATLRVFCHNPGDPGRIFTSSDTTWDEMGVTWNDPVPADGTLVGTLPASEGIWNEADVTSAIAGDGLVTFVVLPTGGNGADFYSRESGQPPELIVTYSGDEPLEPTCAVSADATSVATLEAVTFEATASDPDGGAIVLVEWDFDWDGFTFDADATGSPVTNSWASDGTYSVAMRATDDEAQSCMSTVDVTVGTSTDAPPDTADVPDLPPDAITDSEGDGAGDPAMVPAGDSSGCGCALVL